MVELLVQCLCTAALGLYADVVLCTDSHHTSLCVCISGAWQRRVCAKRVLSRGTALCLYLLCALP
jgi:hypothetical protein